MAPEYPECPRRAPGREEKGSLALDRDRLEEATEAWVPVVTADGPGVLIFENSD